MAHTVVLTGFRLLPRQDLVRNRLFFLLGNHHISHRNAAAVVQRAIAVESVRSADTVSASTAYCLHQAPNFLPVLLLQQCQHVFYVCTWDR